MYVIKVVVVDDEAVVRSGLRTILNAAPDVEVVAATTGAGAFDAVRDHRPDVVLLDIRMPDVDGLTVLGRLRTLAEPPVVAMLTTFDADEYVLSALHAGATGFLHKDTDPEDLAHLVRTLDAGGVVMSSKASRMLLPSLPPAEVARVEALAGPDLEVLVLLAQGLSNTEIGVRLHLGTGAVQDRVGVLLARLGVTCGSASPKSRRSRNTNGSCTPRRSSSGNGPSSPGRCTTWCRTRSA